ncbi:MAG: SDR family NAD(P)-dependent oxidoreductase [Bacteroidota bacterium]|nr:SDR family NAD(P)-dependent oxidoreductase [Bacteroidota bacterium]
MDKENKTICAVSGATGAIGKAIARQLASKANHKVVLIVRDQGKAEQTLAALKNETGNEEIYYEIVDLSRKVSIKALAGRWKEPLHILVNNASVTPRRREETPQGIEMQFATNVLGYFWMMDSFAQILSSSAPARIVNVASYWAGDLDLDDLEFNRRRYNNNEAYRQSKQANRMLTVAFADQLRSKGITVNACHPGDVNSALSNNLGFGGHETPDQAARTPAWLATDPIVREVTGKYFSDMREEYCRFGQDRELVEELYKKCLEY